MTSTPREDPREETQRICAAYERDADKPEVRALKRASRVGRKYGFPLTCTLQGKPEAEQLHWAACLLLEVAQTWPREDVPKLLSLERDTRLFGDAQSLLSNALGATAAG